MVQKEFFVISSHAQHARGWQFTWWFTKPISNHLITCDSRVVPHLSTRQAQWCLTAEFGRDLVFPPWYDRMTNHMLCERNCYTPYAKNVKQYLHSLCISAGEDSKSLSHACNCYAVTLRYFFHNTHRHLHYKQSNLTFSLQESAYTKFLCL